MTAPYRYGPATIIDIRSRPQLKPRDPMRDALDAAHTRIAELTNELDCWQIACLCETLLIVVLFALLVW